MLDSFIGFILIVADRDCVRSAQFGLAAWLSRGVTGF